MRQFFVFLSVLAIGALTAGCGGDDLGRTVPVKGTVTAGGQPLKGGFITFWPDDAAKGGFEAAGSISDTGTYELSTRGKPGARPGKYKVTLAPPAPDNKNPVAAGKAAFDVTTYQTKEKTPLSVEVADSPKSGQYDFTVK